MIYANNLEVNYEVVKPEELSPKERAQSIVVSFLERTPDYIIQDNKDAAGISIEHAKATVEIILHLPLIGSGRMQPENLSDLKYWKDVLSELEKM